MKKIILISLIFISLISNSQENVTNKKWILKTNLISFVDVFSFPTVQISVERKLSKNISINLETGWQVYNLGLNDYKLDTLSIKNRGFKVNIEGRFYVSSFIKDIDFKGNNPFLGIQFFYRGYNYGNSVYYIIDPNYDKPYNYNQENNIKIEKFVDEYEVEKSIYGLNLTAGMQLKLYKNLIWEPYVGAGIMDWKVKNFNRSFKNNKIETTTCNHCFFTDFSEDSGLKLSLTYGFRVGYKL